MSNEFSARKLMVIILTITFCAIMFMVTLALMAGKVNLEIFLAIFAPFSLIVREVCDKYFGRTDREQKGTK
jgi:membrane protein implicated in regulation of membrane protease activity